MPITTLFGGKKGKGKPPKFGDEGEPSTDKEPRGAAAGADDGSAEGETEEDGDIVSPDSMGGGGEGAEGELTHGDDYERAADDVADMLGVAPEDRPAFGESLKAMIVSCLAEHMRGEAEGGAPDEMAGTGSAGSYEV